MPIIINVDVMLARRKMSSGELAQKIGISRTSYRKLEKEGTTIINEKIYRIGQRWTVVLYTLLFPFFFFFFMLNFLDSSLSVQECSEFSMDWSQSFA